MRVLIVAVMAGIQLFIVIAFLRTLVRGGAIDGWPVAGVMVLALGFWAVRFCRIGLFITPDNVIVRNMNSTHRVSRTHVVALDVRESPMRVKQLYLVTSLGKHLPIQVLRVGPPLSRERLERFQDQHRELNYLLFTSRPVWDAVPGSAQWPER